MSLLLLESFEDGHAIEANFAHGFMDSAVIYTDSLVKTGTRSSSRFRFYTPVAERTQGAVWGAHILSRGAAESPLVDFLGEDTGAPGTYRNACRIDIAVGGKIVIRNKSNVVVAESDVGVVSVNFVWHWIEVKVHSDPAVGSVEVRVDNTTVVTATNIDTQALNAAAQIDGVTSNQGSNQRYRYDNIIFSSVDGTAPNDFVGEHTILSLWANANGTNSALVGSDADSVDNYLQVDTGPVSDLTAQEATYNGSPNVGDKDTYNLDDLTPVTGNILGVEIRAWANKSDSAAKSARLVHVQGATETAGSDFTMSTSYRTIRWPLALNPSDGAAWQITDVNASEIGFEVRT